MPFCPCLISFLRPARAQRLGQVVPELEEPGVEHHQDAPDVTRAGFVEEQRALGVLKYSAGAPSPSRPRNFIATSASKKSAIPRGWSFNSAPSSAPGQPAPGQLGENSQLDRGEQDLGVPEAEGGLQDGRGIKRRVHMDMVWFLSIKAA